MRESNTFPPHFQQQKYLYPTLAELNDYMQHVVLPLLLCNKRYDANHHIPPPFPIDEPSLSPDRNPTENKDPDHREHATRAGHTNLLPRYPSTIPLLYLLVRNVRSIHPIPSSNGGYTVRYIRYARTIVTKYP